MQVSTLKLALRLESHDLLTQSSGPGLRVRFVTQQRELTGLP